MGATKQVYQEVSSGTGLGGCRVHTSQLSCLSVPPIPDVRVGSWRDRYANLPAPLVFMERGVGPNRVFCSHSLLFETHDYNSVKDFAVALSMPLTLT